MLPRVWFFPTKHTRNAIGDHMNFRHTSMIGVVFVVSFVARTASAQGKNPPGVNPEHFQCYSVIGHTVPTQRVALRDQFGVSDVTTARAMFLCAPVSKNNEAPKDTVTHLVCYQVSQHKAAAPRVTVQNQFGTQVLTVGVPQLLCVPSLKTVLGHVPTGSLTPQGDVRH